VIRCLQWLFLRSIGDGDCEVVVRDKSEERYCLSHIQLDNKANDVENKAGMFFFK